MKEVKSMEIIAEAAIVLWGFSALMLVFTVSEVAFLAWDKLYKHIRQGKEKAPRTVQRSKAQTKNTSNKSVA